MKRLLLILLGTLVVGACGNDDSSSPTTPGNNTPTVALTGQVTVSGATTPIAGATLLIADGPKSGTSTTTDAAGNYTFNGLPISGFTLTASAAGYDAQNKSVNLTSAQTVSFALAKTNPLFVRGGSGDTVFDLPAYVARVRVVAIYPGPSSSFIVKIGGRLVVNELLGTAWPSTAFDGTYLTTGGVVEITNSTGVAWTFTEVR